MTPLCELARKYETDKGGGHLRYGGGDSDSCHAYTEHYHHMFADKRDTVRAVLEIGVNRGCSLKTWAEYFPNARIIGIDSDAACMVGGSNYLPAMVDPRIVTLTADQNNADDLRRALGDRLDFDVIIDDGSHERPHQLVSLQTLLPYLKPGGTYVVEDLGPRFYAHELDKPSALLGWPSGVIVCEGGLGKASPIEHLFWVKRP